MSQGGWSKDNVRDEDYDDEDVADLLDGGGGGGGEGLEGGPGHVQRHRGSVMEDI